MDIIKFPIKDNMTIEEWASSMHFSLHKLNELINLKDITCKKGIVSFHQILDKGDILYINCESMERVDYFPTNEKLNIIYEDDYLLIVDKPPFIPVYDDEEVSLASIVRNYYNEIGLSRKIRHVHRLDVETSGLLLIAKDVITHAALSYMLEQRTLKRYYLVKVEGKLPKNGTIDAPIGKNRHESGKMMVINSGKEAITNYESLFYHDKDDYTIARVNLLTGRTHQIRVHMAYIKHPVIGDKLYGNKSNDLLQLLSYEMQFIHPVTLEKLDIIINRTL